MLGEGIRHASQLCEKNMYALMFYMISMFLVSSSDDFRIFFSLCKESIHLLMHYMISKALDDSSVTKNRLLVYVMASRTFLDFLKKITSLKVISERSQKLSPKQLIVSLLKPYLVW